MSGSTPQVCRSGRISATSSMRASTRNPSPSPVSQHKFELMEAPATKRTYTDIRQRRSLGKRILKAVQPQVEKALRMECDISSKPYDDLHKELLTMMEASFEVGRSRATTMAAANGDPNGGAAELSQDIVMSDAPGEPEITVASLLEGEVKINGHVAADADDDADVMDTSPDGAANEGGSIEVNTSSLLQTNGVASSNASMAGGQETTTADKTAVAGQTQEAAAETEQVMTTTATTGPMTNGVKETDTQTTTPPATNGYVGLPRINVPAPPTPPQSNGSLGKEAPDVLTEGGGVPWYLKTFDPHGLSVVVEQWAGKDIVRGLSEDLTDIDDDELKGLGLDVNGGAIVAAAPATPKAAPDTLSTTDGILASTAKSRSSKVRKRPSSTRKRR